MVEYCGKSSTVQYGLTAVIVFLGCSCSRFPKFMFEITSDVGRSDLNLFVEQMQDVLI